MIRPTQQSLTPADQLHDDRPNQVLWSRANLEEALPGVVTPLSWSFWARGSERSSRRLYHEQAGLMSRSEALAPVRRIEDQLLALYYGRVAVNVDQLRGLMDRVPGADPDAFEKQLLGRVRPDATRSPTLRRVPAILARLPLNVALLPRRVRALRTATDQWWRRVTAPGATVGLTAGRALIVDALERFVEVNAHHGFCVFVGQAGYDKVAKLCATAGKQGLELRLAASGQKLEEKVVMDDLWHVALGALSLEEFLTRHGYHAPNEGELSSRSWREDPGPVETLVRQYGAVGARSGAGVGADRAAAVSELRAGLRLRHRASVGPLLRFLDVYLPLREVGKAAFLQTIDAARCGARAAGRALVEARVLDDVDEVFLLTWEELFEDPARVDTQAVEGRRGRRSQFAAMDIPDSFVGIPEPVPVNGSVAPSVVKGLGASPGVVEGRARVVTDPADAGRLEPGEILVCALTDPGWTPLFVLASGVVIDIGGPLSHGAIVAREMGIPAVIGTGDGTKRIPDGAAIRVDGTAGTAEVVA